MRIFVRLAAVLVAAILLTAAPLAAAQEPQQEPQSAAPTGPVTRGTDVYCTGYIADAPPRTDLQIIGAEQENIRASFAQGDVVFLNRGRGSGIQPGAVYSVIRPLGAFKHPFTKKKFGTYVRELGFLRVLEVGDQTSTAEIIASCDIIEFGDLLKPYEEYVPPGPRDARPLPRYGEGSHETVGQIIMSPGYHEHLSANRVVYIDIGQRQDVRPGDYFTIYRKIGRSEGITKVPYDKVTHDKDKDFGSDRFEGGEYSVQSRRVPTKELMRDRPPIPRKVLGEMIVLKVEKSSAVALITRTTAEVTIGDFIERAN